MVADGITPAVASQLRRNGMSSEQIRHFNAEVVEANAALARMEDEDRASGVQKPLGWNITQEWLVEHGMTQQTLHVEWLDRPGEWMLMTDEEWDRKMQYLLERPDNHFMRAAVVHHQEVRLQAGLPPFA